MEIKAELKCPYTEEQRVQFIVENNHKNGYIIKEIGDVYTEDVQVLCTKEITEVVEQPKYDEDFNPILDEEGNPVYEEVEITRQIPEMETVTQQVTEISYDENGEPFLDEEGNIIYTEKEVEVEVKKYRTETVTKTGITLQALGYTKKEIKEQEKEARKVEIQKLLDDLDTKRVRAICEPEIKDEKTGETWLDYYNAEVLKLREELNSL